MNWFSRDTRTKIVCKAHNAMLLMRALFPTRCADDANFAAAAHYSLPNERLIHANADAKSLDHDDHVKLQATSLRYGTIRRWPREPATHDFPWGPWLPIAELPHIARSGVLLVNQIRISLLLARHGRHSCHALVPRITSISSLISVFGHNSGTIIVPPANWLVVHLARCNGWEVVALQARRRWRVE